MTLKTFNFCLLFGWLLIVIGVALAVSPGAGLAVGGALMVLLTLLVARWAGVVKLVLPDSARQHQPERGA
jgi:hypothetical protein